MMRIGIRPSGARSVMASVVRYTTPDGNRSETPNRSRVTLDAPDVARYIRPMTQTIAAKITEARVRAGLSQRQLASLVEPLLPAGMVWSETTLRNRLDDDLWLVAQVIAIATVLDVAPADLLPEGFGR